MVFGGRKSPARIWLERTEADPGLREEILAYVERRTGITSSLVEYGERLIVPLLTAMALAEMPWRDAREIAYHVGPDAVGPLDWLEVRARHRQQDLEDGFRSAIKKGVGCPDAAAVIRAGEAMQTVHKMAAEGLAELGATRGGYVQPEGLRRADTTPDWARNRERRERLAREQADRDALAAHYLRQQNRDRN